MSNQQRIHRLRNRKFIYSPCRTSLRVSRKNKQIIYEFSKHIYTHIYSTMRVTTKFARVCKEVGIYERIFIFPVTRAFARMYTSYWLITDVITCCYTLPTAPPFRNDIRAWEASLATSYPIRLGGSEEALRVTGLRDRDWYGHASWCELDVSHATRLVVIISDKLFTEFPLRIGLVVYLLGERGGNKLLFDGSSYSHAGNVDLSRFSETEWNSTLTIRLVTQLNCGAVVIYTIIEFLINC